jgi:peptide/nickel transport system permease protein
MTATPPEFTGTAFGDTLDEPVVAAEGEARAPHGIGPYALAWRRLRRNKVALAFGGLFLLIVVMSLLAPLYASQIAHIGPDTGNVTGQVRVDGKLKDIVTIKGIPLGPTWQGRYLLGADGSLGRDEAVRLLYGGRNSLFIGFVATLITMLLAMIFGIYSGFRRGAPDAVISRIMDIIWSFPVVLLAVALGTALALGGINVGLFTLQGDSLWVPALIIGVVYVPYVSKPLRGQVLGLREKEFVDAARAQGQGSMRIMWTEILPNVASTLIVFVPLILANAILLEAGLSYLGAGVQPPAPSWGTMISAGVNEFPGSFNLVLAPGIMLVLAVLGINVFGDGVRDALDPRSKVRIEH